jgi:RNA polymerase sigma-70 factor (ECF subfamily)
MNSPSFHSTRWTLVQRAGLRSDEGNRALSELCEIYYEPVFRFVLHRVGHEDRARDLVHSFFEGLLSQKSLGSPDPERGRFRSYLLGAVKHFLARDYARAMAAKRGGESEHVELRDESPGEEGDHASFDRDWAHALIRRAHDALEQEMETAGKSEQFQVLRAWLDGSPTTPRATAAAELGMSDNSLKVAIHRLRQKFREKVRNEVASTTSSEVSIDEEFRHLIEVLSKS